MFDFDETAKAITPDNPPTMVTYRLVDSDRTLTIPQAAESDRASGCGVMRGALIGGAIWAALLAVFLAF